MLLESSDTTRRSLGPLPHVSLAFPIQTLKTRNLPMPQQKLRSRSLSSESTKQSLTTIK
jgi:hypothetical protein